MITTCLWCLRSSVHFRTIIRISASLTSRDNRQHSLCKLPFLLLAALIPDWRPAEMSPWNPFSLDMCNRSANVGPRKPGSSPDRWHHELRIHSMCVHSAAPTLQLIGPGGGGCRKILWTKPSLVTSIGTAWRINHVGREGGGIKQLQPPENRGDQPRNPGKGAQKTAAKHQTTTVTTQQ